MGREKKAVRALGEDIALRFVKAKGYRIRHTNFRTPFGELDIVARSGETIVFIEVRTRATFSLGPPFLSVARTKQLHLIKNALFYLKRYGCSGADWRIDVISVKLGPDGRLENIEHIENAVEDIY